MKVKFENFMGTERELDLATYLQPAHTSDHGGAFENIEAYINANNTAIGNLLECLVEKKILTFKEAERIAGERDGELIE